MIGLVRISFDVEAIDGWLKALRLPAGVRTTLIDGIKAVLYDSKIKKKVTVASIGAEQQALAEQPFFSSLSGENSWADIYVN